MRAKARGDAQREIKDASERCVCETCERRKRRGPQESDAQAVAKCKQTEGWNVLAVSNGR